MAMNRAKVPLRTTVRIWYGSQGWWRWEKEAIGFRILVSKGGKSGRVIVCASKTTRAANAR